MREIQVSISADSLNLFCLTARGTSEIGKFGYRVGDPLIGNVTAILPGARGYPVQVRLYSP
jgi:hypothetical protein